MRHRTFTLLTAVTLLAANGASAQTDPPQFTFIVPVQLTSLVANVSTAAISCTLMNVQGGDFQTGVQELGKGQTPIALSKACLTCAPANFSGNVTVTASVTSAGWKPDQVTNYSCDLLLNGHKWPGPEFETKPGTPLMWKVSGTL